MSSAATNRVFDSSAMFLLDLAWPNLFEPADAGEMGDWLTFRCKGCGCLLTRPARERHFKRHAKAEHLRKQREIQQNRERALKKAREARRAA